MNTKNILLCLLLMITSFGSWAQSYRYNAEVKGMVCAFCAYSVSKNVSRLAGVDADSVDVNLKGGHVTFNSSKKVSEEKLAALFADSGFSISHLTVSETSKKSAGPGKPASLDLQLDVFKIDQLSRVVEAIGNVAADDPSRLVINAPLAQEETILKPLLMGRQQVIKVRFIPTESKTMRLQLFDNSVNSGS